MDICDAFTALAARENIAEFNLIGTHDIRRETGAQVEKTRVGGFHAFHYSDVTWEPWRLGGVGFTNVSRALQNILPVLQKSYLLWQFQAETLYVSMALGTRTVFQLEILIINVISGVVYSYEITWRAPETLVRQPPLITRKMFSRHAVIMMNMNSTYNTMHVSLMTRMNQKLNESLMLQYPLSIYSPKSTKQCFD